MPIDNFSSPFVENQPYQPTPNAIANNDEHFAAYEKTVSDDSVEEHRAQVREQYVAASRVAAIQETVSPHQEESPTSEMTRQMENLSDVQLVEYIVTIARFQVKRARADALGIRNDYDLAA